MKTVNHLLLLGIFLTLQQITTAQTVDIIRKSAFQPAGKGADFAFLEPSTDSSSVTFIASIKATGSGKHRGIDELYYKLKQKAQETGANSFRLNNYTQSDSNNTTTLTLDTYYANDSVLDLNFSKHEKNVIYIFGAPDKTGKASSFKIDNEKKELQGGFYYKQAIKEQQEVKINKGGFTGATLWLTWKENKPASFLSLTGFGLGGGPLPAGTVGMSFNTGRINYIDGNLGLLLTLLLTQSE